MITSLTFRGHGTDTTLTGAVSVLPGSRTILETEDNKKVVMTADLREAGNSGFHWEWFQALRAKTPSPTYPGIPYLCTVSMVGANARGVLWLLGGRLFQVMKSATLHSLEIASRGQKDLADEDFLSIRDCYRILRSWLDACKDNMLTTDERWTAAPEYPDRPTQEQGLPAPLALFQQYKALVYLWNHLLATSSASLQYMVHPADPSGFIVALNIQLMNCADILVANRVIYQLQVNVSSLQTPDLRYWIRQTISRSTPDGVVSSPAVSATLSGTVATISIEDTPAGLLKERKYQIQLVFEILPYYDETAVGAIDRVGNEADYYESRKNNNYTEQGTAQWTFTHHLTVDGHVLDPVVKTTKAPYVAAPEVEPAP